MCTLDTLEQDAKLNEMNDVIETMLDGMSIRDLKSLIREHIPTDTLYAEARQRGYAGPEDSG